MELTEFHQQIKEAIPALLAMAEDMTWNQLSRNCTFIVSEISNTTVNFLEQRKTRKIEKDRKTPASLEDILPLLNTLYPDIYDLNFFIYKAKKSETIVEVAYYRKSSLDAEYRQVVAGNAPMIHCKVNRPPWLTSKNSKFNINWEHQELLNSIKLFWMGVKLKVKPG